MRETGNWMHMREAELAPPSERHLNSDLKDDRGWLGGKAPKSTQSDKDE